MSAPVGDNESVANTVASETILDTSSMVGTDPIVPISSSSVPIIVKKDAWRKNVLLCQLDDPKLNLRGDSGAVGRINADKDSLVIDLKGRQYQGLLMSGPTVMLLNLAPPVGQKAPVKEVARAEVVTNEFCHLHFTKDVLGSMMGAYTLGDAEASEDTGAGGDDVGSVCSSGSARKKKGGKKQPLISNVMNRKRKSSSKKGSSKRKK